MEIRIHNQTEKKIPPLKTIQSMIHGVCDDISLKAESIDIIFVDDNTLKNMHAEYLDDPTYTDIITFNLGDENIEGELYISLDRALEQAEAYKVPYFNEIKRLIIHGILHLAGYDDIKEEDRSEMKAVENRLVDNFN
jgi:rRNA maturation RNase YbeY